MIQLGYGVMIKGRPSGIWPVNLNRAQSYVARMKQVPSYQSSEFKIVPIYTGEQVQIIAPQRSV